MVRDYGWGVLETGYLTLFRIRDVPVRAHWSLPIGMIFFTGGRLAPGLWLGERALVAWGGVLAQLPILVVTLAVVAALGSPTQPFLADLVYAFTVTNAILIGLNLIPLGPLDGKEAWPLFGLWWKKRRRERRWKQKVTAPDRPQTLREALDEADRNTDA